MNSESGLYEMEKVYGEPENRFSEHYHVSSRTVRNFALNLSVMLNAKIGLVEALQILLEQSDSKQLTKVIGKILFTIQSGLSFAESLTKFPGLFGRLFVNLVQVGEKTGRLDEMLSRISFYLEKTSELKRKLAQALTYPALVISVAIFSTGFLLFYIVPAFSVMFHDFHTELPPISRILFRSSEVIRTHILLFLLVLTGTILFLYLMNSVAVVKSFRRRLLMKIPLVGSVYIKYLISSFCRTLGILLESGIPLLESLDMVLRSSENELIRKDISGMKQAVIQGEKIGHSLREPVLFPPMVSQMIRVGEETASLAPMLIRISDHYDRELDVLVETLSTIIEPLVIIFLGAVIGLVIIAVYLPLFDMTEFIGG